MFFDKVDVIKDEHLYHSRWAGLDYCFAKLNLINYLERGRVNIFMDADSIVNNGNGFDDFVREANTEGMVFGSYEYTNRNERMVWGCHMDSYSHFFVFQPYEVYIKALSSYIMGFAGDFVPYSIIPLYLEFLERGECYENWRGGVPDELIWQIYVNKIRPSILNPGFHKNRINQRINYPYIFFTVPPYNYSYEQLFTPFFLTGAGDFPKKLREMLDNRMYYISTELSAPFGCLYHKKSDFSLLETYYEGRGRVIQEYYKKNGWDRIKSRNYEV
mgnify:CR=1 FL=1